MSAKKKKSLEKELLEDLLDDQDLDIDVAVPSEVSIAELSPEEEELSVYDRQMYTSVSGPNKKDDKTQAIAENPEKPLSVVMPKTEASLQHFGEKTVPIGQDEKSEYEQPVFEGQTKSRTAGEEEVKKKKGWKLPEIPKFRTSVGKKSGVVSNEPKSMSEMNLSQAENLRMAQERILQLEALVEKLRQENEELMAAAETLKKRADILRTDNEKLESRMGDERQIFSAEKQISKDALSEKNKEIFDLKQKLEGVEARLAANMQKVRVRERELENRLELVKMESSAILRNKNEIILDLKRSIDQLNIELENYRNKGLELNQQISGKEETLKRTVKTLRIALTMLEGVDEDSGNKRKAE